MGIVVAAGTVLLIGSGSVTAIDDTRLLDAHKDHHNWLTYGHGYANQRYSGLDQINPDNVQRLVPKVDLPNRRTRDLPNQPNRCRRGHVPHHPVQSCHRP